MSNRARFRELLAEAGRVHIDAPVIAYHLLAHPAYVELTRLLFAGLRAGEFGAQTSALSLYQTLVEPYRRGDGKLALLAERYLGAIPGLEILPVTGAVARQAAEVTAQLGGRVERAVQIASALVGGAALFLTSRSGLRRVAGMQVISLESFAARSGA
ncbi:MAG: type II toxin-antitoxin system VapC family toxin [Gemmatimonadota bacterium]